MNRRELIADMMALGFSQYESQVYLALVAESPVSAYQLAKNAGISTSKVYETLAKLQERDLVTTIWGEPRQYVPQEPARFVESAKSSYLSTLERLQQGFASLAQGRQPNYVWNLEGRAEIIAWGGELIAKAERSVVLAAPADLCREWRTPLLAAHEKGVRLDLLVRGGELADIGLPARQEHVLRTVGGQHRVALVVDSHTALLAGADNGGAIHGAWTQHQAIVAMAEEHVQNKLFIDEIITKNRIVWGQDD